MLDTANHSGSELAEILARHPAQRGSLIPILQDVQEWIGYLSEDALKQIEQRLGISVNEIYGVATFYTQFRFQPPGDHTVHVCQGTACHVRGGQLILREFEEQLAIAAGDTTSDGVFSLQRVACLGCCALAPVVSVDGKVHAGVTRKKVPTILAEYRGTKGGERL